MGRFACSCARTAYARGSHPRPRIAGPATGSFWTDAAMIFYCDLHYLKGFIVFE